ncbi:MAG: restriction endonuclease subunit S [Methylovulum sp.]|nr:restriction endonuclease subunit S [Methylovulum sp.]
MSNRYIQTPESISINTIELNNFTLSSSQYMNLIMSNHNFLYVRDFLSRPLKRSDLGIEIGSINYIGKSSFYFVRTKALQSHSFLPEITSETALPIMPKVFHNTNLKEGDLLISKDSNIGEIVILDKDYPNYMTSGALYKLPIIERKYYLLAFIKHQFFREQLDFIVPKGATIRHAKTMFLDCKIPIPNNNTDNTIKFIEVLTQAIINKEKLIKQRHQAILDAIENELKENQKPNMFKFDHPTINEIVEVGRLDTNLYSEKFKSIDFLIKNYTNGFQTIFDYGFTLSRGQNLQVSNIGTSIYSTKHYDGFYTLMLPKFLSKYGTVDTVEYLGNAKKLKTLEKGDLIIGAEGFEKGRSIVIIEEKEKTITNIHGITIQQHNQNLTTSIFIKCCLDYLRNKGLIDLFAVGGNGGSLAQKYWEYIPFPNFADDKQKEIAKLYHNTDLNYEISQCTLDNFLLTDHAYNEKAGIHELDKTAKQLKAKLNQAIDDIINDKGVDVIFRL